MNNFNVEVVNSQISETHEPLSITNNESNQRFSILFAPLSNSIYLFLVIIVVFLVLSFSGFALREYIYKAEQSKSKKSKVDDNLDYCWNNVQEKPQAQFENSFFEKSDHQNNWIHRSAKETSSPIFIDSFEMTQQNYLKSNESLPVSRMSSVINVIPTRNATIKGDNLSYYYTGVKNKNLAIKEHIYSIDELSTLNSTDMNVMRCTIGSSVDDFREEVVDNSESKRIIINPSFKLQSIRFDSIWKAEKEVNEITDCFISTSDMNPDNVATRKIMIMRLLSFASNSRKMHNPNIYIPKYNSLMDILVDNGIIFELLNISSPLISQALIDMILCYVWCHWNFKRGIHRKKVMKMFEIWKFEGPSIRPTEVLFKYLLNLESGIYTVGKMDILLSKYSENKIIAFLKFVTINSFCNDFVRFIPLIAQAVECTERIWTKRLLYNILFYIVEKHIHCCINEYLLDETNIIKQLVQHGFWIQNDSQVIKASELIHMTIIEKYPSTMSWWNDTEGGLKLINATSAKEKKINRDNSMHKKPRYLLGDTAECKEPMFQESELKPKTMTENSQARVENSLIVEAKVPGSFNFE